MNGIEELIVIASWTLCVVLSIISMYFKARYNTFKQIARELVDTAGKLLDIIDDDKITEDEFEDLIIHLKCLVVGAKKIIGHSKK